MLSYGECGFRMQDRRVNEMMMGDRHDVLNGALNSPLILTIRYDSVYKFFRALPERLLPSSSMAQQVNAQSLISAEMQRVISAFLIMRDRVVVDSMVHGYTARLIFQWAIGITESNHFAETIFELCHSDGAGSRLHVGVFDALRGDFD